MKKKKRYCECCGQELPPERRKRYCFECGLKNLEEAIRQQQEKAGPIYDKWVSRWKEGVRRVAGESLP